MLNALQLEELIPVSKSQQAGSKLNICAIMSQLDRHHDAIHYCQMAIEDLLETLKVLKISLVKQRIKRELMMRENGLSEEDLAAAMKEDRPTLH